MLIAVLLAALPINVNWYLLPLAAVVSLVYNASRYEDRDTIVRRAVRWFLNILIGMAVVFGILVWLSWRQ